MEPFFVFRDGLGRTFRVVWDGKASWLEFFHPAGCWSHLRKVEDPEELDAFMASEIPASEYEGIDTRVEEIGRGFYMVRSSSRPDVVHIVDLEPNVYGLQVACSCEQNRFRKVTCHHIAAVERFTRAQSANLLMPLASLNVHRPLVPIARILPRRGRAGKARRAHPRMAATA